MYITACVCGCVFVCHKDCILTTRPIVFTSLCNFIDANCGIKFNTIANIANTMRRLCHYIVLYDQIALQIENVNDLFFSCFVSALEKQG